jgi:hypothetical protein
VKLALPWRAIITEDGSDRQERSAHPGVYQHRGGNGEPTRAFDRKVVTRPPCDLPHMRYISFSYSDEITAHNNNKMVRLIQSPTYQQLWGDRFKMTKTGERRLENNKTGFKGPSINN